MSHNTALTDSRLVVKRRAAVPIKRKLYVINFIGDERTRFGVNNADIDTLRTSLMLRMYYCEVGGVVVSPHLPEQDLVNARLGRAEKALLRYLRGSKPATMEDIVLMYRSRKRKIYEQALSEYHLYGCQRSDSVSNSFVKCEKTNVTKAPRNIQPRNPVYNLELATWLKPLEKRVQKTFKRMFGQHTILKGYDANVLGDILHQKWDSFKEPVAVGLDAVKFDMHFSPAVLNWEHQIYNRIFNDHRLRQLLTWQMFNIGRGRCYDGSLRYRVKGKRFSGDINTSMGNCLVMCSIIYSYFKEYGINGQLANNGDDCVIFVEKVDLDRLKTIGDWFNDLGFRVTLEKPVYMFEEIEFCQCHPLYINNHWRMVRNIPTAMSKDAASVYDFPNEHIVTGKQIGRAHV